MRRVMTVVLVLAMSVGLTGVAAAKGYGWNGHAEPFSFLFGNHIDTHQQSKLVGQGDLQGFFYIRFTGDTTDDGFDVAKHADCDVVQDECTVGWKLKGTPIRATYLGHPHGEHPQWCVDPADLPKAPGYTHFHWLDESEHAGGLTVGEEYDGFLLKLTAVDTFHFEHHGGFDVTPGIDEATHFNIVVAGSGC